MDEAHGTPLEREMKKLLSKPRILIIGGIDGYLQGTHISSALMRRWRIACGVLESAKKQWGANNEDLEKELKEMLSRLKLIPRYSAEQIPALLIEYDEVGKEPVIAGWCGIKNEAIFLGLIESGKYLICVRHINRQMASPQFGPHEI